MSETKQSQNNPLKIVDTKEESVKSESPKKATAPTENVKSPNKLSTTKTNSSVKETENIDWFALARKLRHDNRQIIKNLVEREEELALVKEQLEAQIIKTQSADNLVQQQIEELNLANEQITRMLQELETAQQIINEKQALIDEYSTQITEFQQQLGSLERQCSHLQDNYQKEKQKATLLEQKLTESELRLKREQRHNLQFKAALDQCLETPGYVTPVNIGTEEQQTPAIISPNSRIPKNEGIKPWSTYLEELENIPEEIANNYKEAEEKVEPKPENFINRIKVLNNTNFEKNEIEKQSPSPRLNRSNYQTKPKIKREIVLPQFRRLKLDD